MLQTCRGMMSLILDLCISLVTNSYLALIVHFIYKNWILRKYILALSYIPSSHIGVALENKLYDILGH